jgi:hypothetical protein
METRWDVVVPSGLRRTGETADDMALRGGSGWTVATHRAAPAQGTIDETQIGETGDTERQIEVMGADRTTIVRMAWPMAEGPLPPEGFPVDGGILAAEPAPGGGTQLTLVDAEVICG